MDSLQPRMQGSCRHWREGLRIERFDIAGLQCLAGPISRPTRQGAEEVGQPPLLDELFERSSRVEQLSLKGDSVEVILAKGHAELQDLDDHVAAGARRSITCEAKTRGEIQRTGD